MGKLPVYHAVLWTLCFVALGSCAAERIVQVASVDDVYVTPEAAESLLTISVRDRLASSIAVRARVRTFAELSAVWDSELGRVSHHYPAVLQTAYREAPDLGWWLEADGSVSNAGKILRETLENADRHVLNPTNYRVGELGALSDALAVIRAELKEPFVISWTPEEVSRLGRFVQEHGDDLTVMEKILAQVLDLGVMGRRSVTLMEKRQELYRRFYTAAARLDVALSDGLVGYAWDLRVVPGQHLIGGPFEEDSRRRVYDGPYGEMTPEERLSQERQERERLFLSVVQSRAGMKDALVGLEPPFEQYGRILGAYEQYGEFCAAGGWNEVKGKRTLRLKRKGADVEALRNRLAAEGYDVGVRGADAPFGAILQAAVMSYQRTHQYDETGEVDKKLRMSLNVSCETRLAQLGVTLQKWRQTHIGNSLGTYLFVNIPDYHGEYWEGGQLIHRFRVVVGRRTREKYKKETRYKWATPELSSELRHLVFNPYWHVPASIMKDDGLMAKMEEDPEYAFNHHLEILEEGGETVIRQLPGPWNALGKVKFVFKNPYNVYLHDTPQQSKFRYPVRSFSHGCMRVEDATKLAEILLQRQGKWRKKYLRKEGKPDWWVSLPQPIPIFIEYYVVRVDDEGGVRFGSDLYRRDVYRVARFAEENLPTPTAVKPD